MESELVFDQAVAEQANCDSVGVPVDEERSSEGQESWLDQSSMQTELWKDESSTPIVELIGSIGS